jgi:hypothetical protein
MANRKVTDFTSAGALTGAEIVPVVRSGNTDNFRTTTAAIAALAGGGASPTLALALTQLGAIAMNNTANAYFAAGQVFSASADAHYVDGVDGVTPGMLQFDTAGTYRVTMLTRISPTSGGGWPQSGPTLYGILANSTIITKAGRPVMSAAMERTIGWVTDLIVNMAEDATLELALVVENYDNPANGVFIEGIQVTAQKIGDYVP